MSCYGDKLPILSNKLVEMNIKNTKLASFFALAFGAVTLAATAAPVTIKDDINYKRALEQRQAKRSESSKPSKPSPLTEDDKLTMKAFNQHLLDTMPSPGLTVGKKAPDFTLVNAFGKPVSLYKELKKGPVILVFYRGAWCPFCNLHLHVLNKAKPLFAENNAQVIAVTPQQPNRSKEQIEKDGYPFEVLSDTTSQVMKDYQLYFELSPELVKIYEKLSLNLASYNGIGRNVLPVPGTFVIDKSGKIAAMQAQVDYKERMEPEDILKALEAL